MVKCYKSFNIIIDYNVLIGKNGNVIIVMDFLISVFCIACIWLVISWTIIPVDLQL